jgi:hypothetical protein
MSFDEFLARSPEAQADPLSYSIDLDSMSDSDLPSLQDDDSEVVPTKYEKSINQKMEKTQAKKEKAIRKLASKNYNNTLRDKKGDKDVANKEAVKLANDYLINRSADEGDEQLVKAKKGKKATDVKEEAASDE